MQLKPWRWVLVGVVGCGGPLPPRPRAEVTLHGGHYGDNDHVSVWSPSVRARVPVGRRVTVSASYGVDIVSAASVDIVASASRMNEVRHDTTAGAQVAVDDRTTVGVSGRDSRESDYLSDGVTLTVDRENAARTRTLHVEARGRWDRVGPGWVLQDRADLGVGTLAASLTQVLDRLTVLRFALQADVLSGYQASAYRYVPVGGQWFTEQVPELRVRGSGSARIQRSLRRNVSLLAEYGLSGDSWGLVAHSGEVGLRWEPAPWAMFDVRARVMAQNGASFYQGTYASLTEYRTRDRMLGPMEAFWPTASFRFDWPAWPAPPSWEVGVRGGWLHQQFEDFVPLRSRDAGTGEVWITRWF